MRTKLIFIFFFPMGLFGQMKEFSGIHDPVNDKLVNFLERSNFGKVTHYFDNVNQKDGKWELYPTSNINDSLIAVCISTMPNRTNEYTFLILVNLNNMSIEGQFGPYYDSYIDALKVKIKNNEPYRVAVRLINPLERLDPKYTFYEYQRRGSQLEQTKTYNKN